jgi:integrase
LKYRKPVVENGKEVRKQVMERLVECSPRYRRKSDLKELVAQKLLEAVTPVKAEATEAFAQYVEKQYLPFVKEAKKPSTYAAYEYYFQRYIKPFSAGLALRDFDIAKVAEILEKVAKNYKVNSDTISKVRSVMSAIFSYAIGKGHYPARSEYDNPAHGASLPVCPAPAKTVAASREQVVAILQALRDLPQERAAVAIVAMMGLRPGECRGLRWRDWDRVKDQITVERSVWHRFEGSPKTEQSVRVCAVPPSLRGILTNLWKAEGQPIDGYILAGERHHRPVSLDNLAKRSIRAALKKAGVAWTPWYSMRRFHGTAVRKESNLQTTSKALGNSPSVADKHYVKPADVLPDVREAVLRATKNLG